MFGDQQHPRAGVQRPVPKGTTLLKNIQLLSTFNKNIGDIKDAAIYVRGNVILWVGPTSDLPSDYAAADLVLSFPDRVVIPGLINSHHHMSECLTRCFEQDSTLFGWLQTCDKAWVHLTGPAVYTAARVAMAELILSGCTTSSDHLYLYPNDVRLEDTIRAAREVGIRFHPTRGALSVAGGVDAPELCEDEDHALADMRYLIKEFHDPARYSMLRIGLAPCAPFNVSPEFMTAAAQLARQHPGVRLHTHLAENQEDVDYMQEHYGCSPSEYCRRVNWVGDDVWFAHCCALSDRDISNFEGTGIGITHCPSSNMRLASGIAPVRKFQASGLNVGLAVDGSASNDAGCLVGEARLAMFLQRSGGRIAGSSARGALQLALEGSSRNLGRDDVGQVAPGFAADLVAWRTDTLAFAGAQHDPVAALVFCGPSIGTVDFSMINGDIIVRDGKLLTLELKEVLPIHNKHAADLLKKM